MKRKMPLWKRSCIETLMFERLRYELDEIAEVEYEYSNSERREEFEVFLGDVSARVMWLSELFYDYQHWFKEDNDFSDWNDICVVLFGNKRNILGYDDEQQDYYGLFNSSYDHEFAIEEARKRIDLLRNQTKCVIISA